ncbi:hypothetical protein C0992_012724 [Termitomyces sp. T32_za158]|nr:hypothetical protein C0992_012724 [Termitomyces sp. T32_za158]
MDVVKAVETYVLKLIETPSTMKVLLLDSHTTPIVSLAATQSTLLSHQVYLTDRIDNKKRDRMPHMKCVCFLQNTEDSLAALEAELSEPNYGEYYLCQLVNLYTLAEELEQPSLRNNVDFSNILSKNAIERLAEADEYEVVKEVQEYFADYTPLLPCLFSLNHTPTSSKPLYGSSPNTWDIKALEQTVQGLTAVLLSLKKKPIIRYEKMSGMAKKLANEVQHQIRSEPFLFDFRPTQVAPLLLILDRRNDPVTPLLSQWTYQAMVHELLEIQNGRVDMKMVPDIRPELAEILLTTNTDPFFQAHYLATFGDLGTSLKDYVQSYQSRSMAHSPSSINSISDMKKFIEEYPEFKKLGGNVSKHVALVGELSRLVGRDKLLEIGEIEQGLATSAGADFRLSSIKTPLLQVAGYKTRQAHVSCSAAPAYTILLRMILLPLPTQEKFTILTTIFRYLEMIRSAAALFPSSVYEPPPESASNAPSLNLNLGGVNVSLGGTGGTGVFRTSGDGVGMQTDGIRDGVLSLFDKVKQGVDRIGMQ